MSRLNENSSNHWAWSQSATELGRLTTDSPAQLVLTSEVQLECESWRGKSILFPETSCVQEFCIRTGVSMGSPASTRQLGLWLDLIFWVLNGICIHLFEQRLVITLHQVLKKVYYQLTLWKVTHQVTTHRLPMLRSANHYAFRGPCRRVFQLIL